MIVVRSMSHVATSRSIPSFRSCRTLSRTSYSVIADQGRTMNGYAQLLARDGQRKWRNIQWYGRG